MPSPLSRHCSLRGLPWLLGVGIVLALSGCAGSPELQPWHTEHLEAEFTVDRFDHREVNDLDDYLVLEERLFEELRDKVYAQVETGPSQILNRYSAGSAADPARQPRNWNRTVRMDVAQPLGGVLLLHGMSDSPYSLRSLGERLREAGYRVVALRLPGHGTAPVGLRDVTWEDMSAAAELALNDLAKGSGNGPIHVIGYSTGAPLAVEATLEALEGRREHGVPASLILVSPAIRVHPTAGLASFKDTLSNLPGLDGLAYLTVMNEFDPYKYNSFATNAGTQVHRVTRAIDRRIRGLATDPAAAARFPPILVFKSTVDATVTTAAVVDNLLVRLPGGRHELVLFDINRNAAIKAALLIDDPAPLTQRLVEATDLPFALTLVTNASEDSVSVVVQHKDANSATLAEVQDLALRWPPGVVSLSHVALPIPPDDPLYGTVPPARKDLVYLGNLAIQGERGLLQVPESWLLRLRFNPFYGYLEDRAADWIATATESAVARD